MICLLIIESSWCTQLRVLVGLYSLFIRVKSIDIYASLIYSHLNINNMNVYNIIVRCQNINPIL